MSQRTGIKRRTWQERALSLLLAAVLLIGLAPGMTLPASAEHWADTYLDQLVDWGVMRADQTGNPNAALPRAEFMAIINRAYGYTEKGEIPFTDVNPTDWFYDDVAIAYTVGYMAGTSENTASPNNTLTREQAVCILGRNMMLKETPGESLPRRERLGPGDHQDRRGQLHHLRLPRQHLYAAVSRVQGSDGRADHPVHRYPRSGERRL